MADRLIGDFPKVGIRSGVKEVNVLNICNIV